MTDVVGRLREWIGNEHPSSTLTADLTDAADEIERLRAALQHAARRFELLACNNDDMRNGVQPSVGAKEARAALAHDKETTP
jgi:hypothetical protein